MRKILSVTILSLFLVLAIGCGKKENPKPVDRPSSSEEKIVDPREQKEFENLKEKLEFTGTFSDIEYYISIYFNKNKAVNGTVLLKCLNEETAKQQFSSHYNSDQYDQVVRDGNIISYDYNDKSFIYKDKNKDEVTLMIEGQGFTLKK